ncbi:iron hydrogenase [Crepidotus variabilis]|uniref:Cytosolic Fe-S cluster assembly factor NAR1 n=1 Tax=Crepidotus variabilis TaxID=179855 RepID=A0A9P6EM92_9AGAR|nr:iron hydrogenase [Crepidotus variabilis]
MAFSGALTLTDLNDFITPSQACIKPVEQTNKPSKEEEKEPGAASTEILIDSSGAYYEVSSDPKNSASSSTGGPTQKLHQAQISLNDCLACSGCITSAESVLITLQSHTEVFNFLEENELAETSKVPVISIAPQSLASLAAALTSSSSTSSHAPVTSRQILRRLHPFLKSIGFAYVFDTNFARHIALREHIAEFLERKERDSPEAEGQLPMLASACPGWICYAEKAHSEMLPFISQTKSPQQVMGTLVKEWMAKKWDRGPDSVYHVTVMPCYDKKLEASRQDFYNDIYSTRDVDCVITTGELELMMKERGWDIDHAVPGELDDLHLEDEDPLLPELVQHSGTSSGSYLHSIIDHLRVSSPVPLSLSVKMIRNADYEEYTLVEELEDGPGKVVFKGAKCYGFRNLQNIVRKVGKERGLRTGGGAAGRLSGRAVGLRRGKKAATTADGREDKERDKRYDYVEVMACPGGCVNGGGQLKPRLPTTTSTRDEEGHERNWEESGASVDGIMQTNAKWGDKEWTKKVEEAYWRDKVRHKMPPTPPDTPPPSRLEATLDADAVADQILQGLDEEARQRWFRTSYRAVESDVVGLAVKW